MQSGNFHYSAACGRHLTLQPLSAPLLQAWLCLLPAAHALAKPRNTVVSRIYAPASLAKLKAKNVQSNFQFGSSRRRHSCVYRCVWYSSELIGGSKLGALMGLPRAFCALDWSSSRASSRISARSPCTISRFSVSISPCDRKLPEVECGMVGDGGGRNGAPPPPPPPPPPASWGAVAACPTPPV